MSAIVGLLVLLLGSQVSDTSEPSDRYRSPAAPASDQPTEPAAAPLSNDDTATGDFAEPSTQAIEEPAELPPSKSAPSELTPVSSEPLEFRDPLDSKSRPLRSGADRLVSVRSRPEGANAAAALYRRALELPDGGNDHGDPLTLIDALSSRQPAISLFDVVNAYWTVSARLAAHRLARSELNELESLRSRQRDDDAAIAAARASAAAELADAELALTEARHRLQTLRLMPRDANRPSQQLAPTDIPHTGSYRTEFDRLFPNSLGPVEAKRIHETLPARYAAIDAGARAIKALETVFDQKAGQYERGEIDIDRLLASHERMGVSRQRFLAAVRDYNIQIGRYVSIVVRGSATETQIVRMLIKNPVEPRRLTENSPAAPTTVVRPATASIVEPELLSSAPRESHELPSVLKRSGVVRAAPRTVDRSRVVPAGAEEAVEETAEESGEQSIDRRAQPVESDAPSGDGFRARREP